MSKVKREAEARAEVMMMGLTVPVNDNEVQFMTDYIKTVLGYENLEVDVLERLNQYGKNTCTHMTTKRVYGMPCIVYCLEGEDYPKPFEEDYGTGYPSAFTYVLNLADDDMCSEFGDSFFEKHGNTYKVAS